jgi:hypothetical protein
MCSSKNCNLSMSARSASFRTSASCVLIMTTLSDSETWKGLLAMRTSDESLKKSTIRAKCRSTWAYRSTSDTSNWELMDNLCLRCRLSNWAYRAMRREMTSRSLTMAPNICTSLIVACNRNCTTARAMDAAAESYWTYASPTSLKRLIQPDIFSSTSRRMTTCPFDLVCFHLFRRHSSFFASAAFSTDARILRLNVLVRPRVLRTS